MEKNNKSHKKSSSNYNFSLGESTKYSHYNNYNNGCDNISSSDDDCNRRCKKRCGKTGIIGPPGPLVTTLMGSPEVDGLEPGYQSTYCISPNCNNKYLSIGCYLTIHCTSENTPYFIITDIPDVNVITIENINEYTATWECGARVALIGPPGPTGATGATLFDVAPIAEVSWPYGATLIGESGLIYLQLAPADNANPGLLTTTDQLVAGTKYFQDVFVAANFDGDPYSSWGGFNPGSMYFDTGLNALQIYLGATVGSTFSGTTWCSVLTDCSGCTGGSLTGVTALGATGLTYGATFTGDTYLQLGAAGITYPGIITTTGQTFSGNKYFTGLIGVGNYSSSPSIGITGTIYYDTTIAGSSGLQVSDGSTWTSVKSFVIDHPKDQDKLLVHGCLEGPEAGVYYRGKGVITNNESVLIELPDYVDKLATNLTVQLTPIYDGNIYKPQYFATEVTGNKFEVHGVNGAFYWTVYGQRLSFIVEPNKTEVEIKGDGPYKWL